MIRLATTADIRAMVALGREVHAQSRFAAHPYSESDASLTALEMIRASHGCALVADHGGSIEGFLLGGVMPCFFGPTRVASDLVTYARRPGDGVRLVREFIRWAKARGCEEIEMGISGGINPERTSQLYEKLGMPKIGYLHAMRGTR